ncbi:MAG: hypothetical protein AAGA77_20240 [Bacteroidota bacterium]
MRATLYLILGLIAVFEFGYNWYAHMGEPGRILGFEVPFLPSQLFWGLLGLYFLYRYYKLRKLSMQNN